MSLRTSRLGTAVAFVLLALPGTAGCGDDTNASDAQDEVADRADEVADRVEVDGRGETEDARADVPDVADEAASGGDGEEDDAFAEDAADVPGEVEPEVEVPDGDDDAEAGEPGDGPADAEEDDAEATDAPGDGPADAEEDDAEATDAPPGACPDDMVPSGAICIDRYEASRPDATELSAGTDESAATSRAGALPWMVNPFDGVALAAFESACAAAGKRLCRAEEWEPACRGAGLLPYVYGPTFDREACNCVDTFCDDHCAAAGILPADCDTAADCGYRYMCFHVLPTASMPACTSELGTFDINGNVWEVVLSDADLRGFEIRGGAFNCAMASARVGCAFNATWTALNAGFRCCRDR